MTLEEIISEVSQGDITGYLKDIYPELELVHEGVTNPRRDYLGHIRVWKNPYDGRFIGHEVYGNDMGSELWFCDEMFAHEVTTTEYTAQKFTTQPLEQSN